MPVRLVDDENEWSVDLAVDDDLREALLLQAQRQSEAAHTSASFLRKLARGLTELLVDTIDYDIKPPTQAQLTYALVISKRLGVNIPSEALRYRGTMTAFILRHDQAFRSRLRSRACG